MHAYRRSNEFMHGREALKQEARVDIFENQPTNQTQKPHLPPSFRAPLAPPVQFILKQKATC